MDSDLAYIRSMSDDLSWRRDLPCGLPRNFDYSVLRTAGDARAMMFALPNRDRGNAAVGLYENRHLIGDDVAYHGMMSAWDHDDGWVASAFGGEQWFAECLADVAPPLKLKNPVRLWRGVAVEKGEDPAGAAFGVSWTRSRHIALLVCIPFQ